MSTELQKIDMESVAVREYFRSGNVAQLRDSEKDFVLQKLCDRYGLDPILRPFDLISFQGGQKFYMTASATNQLANIKSLSREVGEISIDEAKMLAKCTVSVLDPQGRKENSTGYVSVARFLAPTKDNPVPKRVMMEGEDLANALLKLETKTKRRATMSFFGVMDSVGDYEDRSVAHVAAPDVSRPQLMRDAATATKVVEASVVVEEAKPTPAPKKERAVKAKEPQAENNAKAVEASIPTLPPEAATIPVEAPAEVIMEVPAQQAAPTSPELPKIVYARTVHSKFLIAAADLILGAKWSENAQLKDSVKRAIPELDGKVNVLAEGSSEVLPEFVEAFKAILKV